MPTPKHRRLLLLLALLLACTRASSQVSVGDNLHMNMDGSLAAGFSETNGNLTNEAHSVTFGGETEIKGDYYDPRFANFVITPYYNQSRATSNVQSIFDSSGLNAAAQMFGGSRFPLMFNYGRNWNHEGEIGIPGSADLKTRGNNQYFDTSFGLYLAKFPSLSASYGFGDSQYEVLGTPTRGSNSSKLFGLRSGYDLWGFTIGAGYSRSHLDEVLPELADTSNVLRGETGQNQSQISISRRIHSQTNFQSSFSRSNYDVRFSGTPTSARYDQFSAALTSAIIPKVTVAVATAYTNNLAGASLLSVDPNGDIARVIAHDTANSLTTDFSAVYRPITHLEFQGGVEDREQDYAGLHFKSVSTTGGASYGRNLLGGTFGISGGASHYNVSGIHQADTSGTGTINYSRHFGRWNANSSFRYAHNVQTALVEYMQSGFGYSMTLSRTFSTWNASLTATGNHSSVNVSGSSDSFDQGYNASFSNRLVSFTGTYNHSGGQSVQIGNSLVPLPPGVPIVPTNLLVLYRGQAYAAALGYTPTAGLRFTADYSQAGYDTRDAARTSKNNFRQLDAKVDWYFRQLHILGGYSRLQQGFGLSNGTPARVNSIYVGVFRTLRFF